MPPSRPSCSRPRFFRRGGQHDNATQDVLEVQVPLKMLKRQAKLADLRSILFRILGVVTYDPYETLNIDPVERAGRSEVQQFLRGPVSEVQKRFVDTEFELCRAAENGW